MKLKPADFARQAGVTRQAVGAKIKNNTLVVDAAGFLDTENPVNSAYISDQGRKPRTAPSVAAAAVSQAAPPVPTPLALQGDDQIAAAAGVPAELLTFTLRELVVRYNGMINLEKHARILRDLTTANEKELRIQERSIKLIEKDFVTARLFSYIDVLMRQLMEYPESVMDAFVARVLSEGADCRGELVSMMRDGLGRIIAGAKDQVIKELNSLKGKYTGNDKIDEISETIREAVGND
ncbi:hypothetical protein AGMMS49944_15790 [Spirochaetia bacterium]|nr:hypothetical protein AGMMS49944_15790 [Spirochaetia bacterium]